MKTKIFLRTLKTLVRPALGSLGALEWNEYVDHIFRVAFELYVLKETSLNDVDTRRKECRTYSEILWFIRLSIMYVSYRLMKEAQTWLRISGPGYLCIQFLHFSAGACLFLSHKPSRQQAFKG